MSGHSKWANIKHRKGAADAKRGKIFTKLAKEIMVAAKEGGSDENANPRLRSAIIKAKTANMPKENIEKAIKKGAGELDGASYEELIYEGYAPGGIAIILEVMTDKKSRVLPEIKNLFLKAGGSFAESGAVSFLFDHKGLILIKGENISEDELLEIIIEAGAEDLEEDDENIYAVITEKASFHSVFEKISPNIIEKGWEILESGLKYLPKTMITLDEKKTNAILRLIDTFENHDEIQNVYSNLELI